MAPLLMVMMVTMHVLDHLDRSIRQGLANSGALNGVGGGHEGVLLSGGVADAGLVAGPLAGGHAGFEHLVDLLEGAALGLRLLVSQAALREEWKRSLAAYLGDIPVDKGSGDQARREPDVAVLRPPVERLRVDEVGRGKGRQPRADEADAGRQPERVRAQGLPRQLAADEPREAGHAAVVRHDVDDGEGDDDAARLLDVVGIPVRVADGGYQLREGAHNQGRG